MHNPEYYNKKLQELLARIERNKGDFIQDILNTCQRFVKQNQEDINDAREVQASIEAARNEAAPQSDETAPKVEPAKSKAPKRSKK